MVCAISDGANVTAAIPRAVLRAKARVDRNIMCLLRIWLNIKYLFNGAAGLINFKTRVMVRRLKHFCFESGSGIRVQVIFSKENNGV